MFNIREKATFAKRCAIFILLVAFASGCGPVYRTEHILTPPETEGGRACIFQCENSRFQCEQIAELRYERCEDRAELEYRFCEDRNRGRDEKDRDYCYRSYCSRDENSCEPQYHHCYQSCGGKVMSKTICVSNCEGVNQ